MKHTLIISYVVGVLFAIAVALAVESWYLGLAVAAPSGIVMTWWVAQVAVGVDTWISEARKNRGEQA